MNVNGLATTPRASSSVNANAPEEITYVLSPQNLHNIYDVCLINPEISHAHVNTYNLVKILPCLNYMACMVVPK